MLTPFFLITEFETKSMRYFLRFWVN